MADIRESQRVSRRRMLGTLGAGAAGVLAGPALIRSDAQAAKGRPPHACAAAAASPTSFGRLFDLEPFARNTARLQQALLEIAKPGGLLDARDDLAAGPVALITDPAQAAAQAFRLARAGQVQTICVHGDTPGAVDILKACREALSV